VQGRGQTGLIIQRKVVEEPCGMNKPYPDAPDQTAGKVRLADLKREAADADFG